jgi:hypothetical protein
VSNNFDQLVQAYTDYLAMRVIEEGSIGVAQAALWGATALVGHRYAVLASESGVAWIRAIEDPQAVAAVPFRQQGWMSLEVLVEDVDQLASELEGSPFELYRPPADLDVSDDIRAMQVIGPAGEVLYLTQVKGPVPPFDIPMARCRVDQLFIPVLCCIDRDDALAFYRQFAGGKDYLFDTKITSVNTAYAYPLERKHPVATVQLAGSTMIEIDQIDAAQRRPQPVGSLPAGIAMISYEVDKLADLDIEWLATPARLCGQPYQGRLAACCRGNGGELVELIERN